MKKWYSGEISTQEEEELSVWLHEWKDTTGLAETLEELWNSAHTLQRDDRLTTKEMITTILQMHPQEKPSIAAHRVHFLKTSWMRWAAAVILFLGIGTYFYFNKQQHTETAQTTPPSLSNVLPGTDKAVLTLSNGKQVQLSGDIASETILDGNLTIENNRGRLSYRNAQVMAINTMTTPKGGQYQLTLADGTRVWLNAASSITFPTAFTGALRQVSVTGEAYFEVARNKSKPFIVQTAKEKIEVLGTSFNVNSYTDEPFAKTSLLEGAIRIDDKVLQPGQAFSNGKIFPTNISQDVAWKNGVFNFDDKNLAQLMRQLSRWYDIEVVYEAPVQNIEFTGKMSRKLSLAEVLDFIKGSQINYRLEGKRLIIMK